VTLPPISNAPLLGVMFTMIDCAVWLEPPDAA
jgi:hypothetical protein